MFDLTSRGFKKNNYYVLYDVYDHAIAYCENYEELQKFTNLSLRNIVNNFKKAKDDFIFIVVNGKKFKLYRFLKE